MIYPLVLKKKNDGKSPCLTGISTISMAVFNSYVSLPKGKMMILPYLIGFLSWKAALVLNNFHDAPDLVQGKLEQNHRFVWLKEGHYRDEFP